jgi:hypothetical protein
VIKNKTVFVLGAGASNPFGLPLGAELKTHVLANYNDKAGHAVNLYNTTTFREGDVRSFITALRYSGLTSVDTFLERRPEFIEIGKATMAIELIVRESLDALWQPGGNWLLYLYSAMIGKSLKEFSENQVSFVTFNYDRSVEHFFAVSLSNSFGEAMGKIKPVLDSIPIIYLHGRLGYLPWEEAKYMIGYGQKDINHQTMETFLKEIKVVHEDIKDGRDKDFSKAKQLLDEARRVYLLGFGFGALNVERIGLVDIEAETFQGTTLNMTSKETAQCKVLCGGRVDLNQNYGCLEFLRNIAVLD